MKWLNNVPLVNTLSSKKKYVHSFFIFPGFFLQIFQACHFVFWVIYIAYFGLFMFRYCINVKYCSAFIENGLFFLVIIRKQMESNPEIYFIVHYTWFKLAYESSTANKPYKFERNVMKMLNLTFILIRLIRSRKKIFITKEIFFSNIMCIYVA